MSQDTLPHRSVKLTIVIPVYNERETLPEILSRVRALAVDKEIIVIDNCSTDGTRDYLESLELPDVRVVLQPANYEKGTSVRKGIELARGEYTVIQDADLEYDPEELLELLRVAEEEGAEAVFGSRFLDPEQARGALIPRFGRNRLNDLFRVLYWSGLSDIATCYKLARTEVLRGLHLRSSGFDLDYEIAAKLAKAGVTIREVPITYRPRTAAQGKKLVWTDGLRAGWALLKFRFVD
ncbi:MAG: glycosyltransferase family 2 protein [Armatimonadota bacterium]